MFGFYRVALCVPEVSVADVAANAARITALVKKAFKGGASAALFPELAVTAYSCADLFHSSKLLDEAEKASAKIVKETLKTPGMLVAFGAPVRSNGRLFNACVTAQSGTICGIVPKSNLPNYREFYEKRYFSPGANISGEKISFAGQDGIPFGTGIIFESGRDFSAAVEICEDMWSTIPPSSYLALGGANLILNPSASNELVGKAAYRRELVKNQSARCVAAYAYASAGANESTTDTVCGGHCLVAENGNILFDGERFMRGDSISFADIDLKRIAGARLSDSPFANSVQNTVLPQFVRVKLAPVPEVSDYKGRVDRRPFVPSDSDERGDRCREIFSIQTAGLAKRIEHTHAKKLVIGISGGLDSTLALLVCARTMKLLKRPAKDIVAVTMPGFGTTGRTYKNAVGLCRALGVCLREINIGNACLGHFKDIGHDPENRSVVYENTQARERTQILLDIANMEGGIAVGTGDLSENAMGWCTYNGDHISMYAVNCSVPKTLVRYVIEREGANSSKEIRAILRDVIDTPVSPELLPADGKGKIVQKTEEIIGPYEVHDFYLYHFLKYGAEPEKMLYLAKLAFGKEHTEDELKALLGKFLRRFFSQQFKRSCSPDGPKVGTISLSPRGDWRMPSDASPASWL